MQVVIPREIICSYLFSRVHSAHPFKMSASGELPASPRDHPYVTLHLYLPSGEFIAEDVVPLGQCVERYSQDLEDHPKLGPLDLEFHYELVWNDMKLEA